MCKICGIVECDYVYQPFGPDENPHEHMTLLGNHYRGFPVIKVCGYCRDDIAKGTPVEFVYKDKRYIASRNEVLEVPPYVEDALLWFEMRPLDHKE